MGAFSAQRDPRTGDVWFTILEGQVFRVRDTRMQYCFGYTAGASSTGSLQTCIRVAGCV